METPESQVRILLEGTEQVLPREEFERKVAGAARGDRPPLRAKFGVDPTSPDIHLGHTVTLRKLRDFQRLGHTAVLIIGGFTAQVGDPSGRTATRPRLTAQDVARNAETYLAQVRKVLLDEHLEVVNNADWLAPMQMEDVLRLTSRMTVARMLERADFAARYSSQRPIALSEFLYPLLQGQDSVIIRSDVELGGTDQKFNVLLAREIQRAYGLEPQSVLTMPILPGIDGVQKMSKSLGNYVGVDEPPEDMFGKLMRVPDDAMPVYYELLLDESPQADPREAKRHMAYALTERYHGGEAARAARDRFDTLHIRRELPDDIEDVAYRAEDGLVHVPALLAQAFDLSRSEARRLLAQGGVKLDGTELDEHRLDLPTEELDGAVLQVGKRRFKRLRPA